MSAAILKVLDISTKFLPEDVAEMMEGFEGVPTMYEHPEHLGTIVVIPPSLHHDANGDPEEEIVLRRTWGHEMIDILKWAADVHGCWAVNFDRDGDDEYDFPTFDW